MHFSAFVAINSVSVVIYSLCISSLLSFCSPCRFTSSHGHVLFMMVCRRTIRDFSDGQYIYLPLLPFFATNFLLV